MKWHTHPVAFALIATSLLATLTLTGCNSPLGNPQPAETRPGVARRGPGPKGPQSAIPITVIKYAPTSPTPFAKGKKAPVRRKSSELPANTSVRFDFSIASWHGVSSVDAVIKCYEVASVYSVSGGGYGITTTGSALQVFNGSSASEAITLTQGGGPKTVYLTFPSSSCQGKQLIVGITGIGDDGENEYDFGGGEIFVVSP